MQGVNQTLDNLLNLALDATERERQKSLELNVGYETLEKTWEVIIRFTGNLESVKEKFLEAVITELSNGYAIVKILQSQLSGLAMQKEIQFIEKPKRLIFAGNQGKKASCIEQLQLTDQIRNRDLVNLLPSGVDRPLFGEKVLVAVVDSGIDYTHEEFRNSDGSTRILAIWDQTFPGKPPAGFFEGSEFTQEEIDQALESGQTLPIRDISGHGTEVTAIAAGRNGVASKADIVVVKLGTPAPDAFPKTTQLMQAVEYVYRKAEEAGLPLVVNLSFGNVYGPHNGTGLLETYLEEMAGERKSVIVIGTGNEGNAAGHTAVNLRQREESVVELGIAPGEPTINVQLWKSYADEMDIYLTSPGGEMIGPLDEKLGPQRYLAQDTELLIYYGEPGPYSISQEIYFDFIPRKMFVDNGIWKFQFVPKKVAEGRFDLWLPAAMSLNIGTRFYRPAVENTLTNPSTARKVIAVGAYDSRSMIYAPFSGRGNPPGIYPFPGVELIKPDLAAPGVDIITASPGGGYTTVSGTSFATPFVTGAAALLMQWGLTDGNDPFLYGEKVRAYLIRGAKELPGEKQYPNNVVGYGVLCVANSLPGVI